MSWDVMVFNYGGQPPSLDQMADAPPVGPLGPAAQVRKRIAAHLPGIDWTDPTWGIYEGDGFSIEFNTGKDDPIDSIMLHVRGGGDAISAMLTFANPNGWSLLDCSTGEFLDPERPSSEGWEGFQEYRDKALGSRAGKKPKGKGSKPKGKGGKPKGKGKRKED
jgi:hypothetical protein